MNNDPDDTVKEMIEKLAKEARIVVLLNRKVQKAFGDAGFSIRMSVLNMALCKTILDEADDINEAMSYVSRMAHALVEVIDRHAQATTEEDANETDEPEETLQ